MAKVTIVATEIPEVRAFIEAFDEFALGVGLFAPQLLELPAFVKMYDARQDIARKSESVSTESDAQAAMRRDTERTIDEQARR